jgi:hypothetical protein
MFIVTRRAQQSKKCQSLIGTFKSTHKRAIRLPSKQKPESSRLCLPFQSVLPEPRRWLLAPILIGVCVLSSNMNDSLPGVQIHSVTSLSKSAS